jgi:putative endonuclease
MDVQYSVYILECADGSYYTGMTSDLDRRLNSHQSGGKNSARHTKMRRPVRLVYEVSQIPSRKLAIAGEKYIKSLTRDKKQKIIAKDHKILSLLYERIGKDFDSI